jgi:archaetidylinositol phosphate synthase
MLEAKYRHLYQQCLVDGFASMLSRVEFIKPKHLSLLSCCSGLLAIPFLFYQHPYWAVLALLISGYLDSVDGTLARLKKTSSVSGAVLDISCDRVVEFAVVMGLYLQNPTRGFWCILMLGSILLCITSFLLAAAASENTSNKSFHYSPGLMERPEAFAFFIAMMIFPGVFEGLAVLFSLLVLYTAAVRMMQLLRQC